MSPDPILVIDNYDSFVYNLVQMLIDLDCEVIVKRNDKITLDEVAQYNRILLSPGPGIPSETAIMPELIKRFASEKKILGVCLGHQGIGEVFGGKLINLKKVHHGVAEKTKIVDRDEYLFKGLPEEFLTGRYHSWIVDKPLPERLVITALDEEGSIMGLRHKVYDVRGVQFHPESVLTEYGMRIIKNWIV